MLNYLECLNRITDAAVKKAELLVKKYDIYKYKIIITPLCPADLTYRAIVRPRASGGNPMCCGGSFSKSEIENPEYMKLVKTKMVGEIEKAERDEK